MCDFKFKRAYVEITNICNLSCSFCPPTVRPKQWMHPEDFEKILIKLKPYTDHLCLHVKGEPLTHPYLSSILQLALKHGFHLNLTTNGTLLKTKGQDLLEYPPRLVSISLHSFEANSHSSLSFDKYMSDIIEFAHRFTSSGGGIIGFRLWNLHQKDSPKMQQKQNALILKKLEEAYKPSNPIAVPSNTHQGVLLQKNVWLNFDYEFQWPSMDAPELGHQGKCHGLSSHIAVLCDGTVVPCCLDENGIIALGNIYEASIEEILNSKRALNMRGGFEKNIAAEPLCRRCGYKCKVCRQK